MKKSLLLLVLALIAATLVCTSCSKKGADLSIVEDIPTVQSFKTDPVPDADIAKIVKAGVNAQSAINKQPWHFSVITNAEVLSQIGGGMSFGGGKPDGFPDGDGKMPSAPNGVATGAKIVSSPTMVLNGANKAMFQEMLGIPSDMNVVAVLLIGKAADEKTDASSGATTRNAEKDVVTYIK